MLVQELWDTGKEQLLTGTGEGNIELTVYQMSVFFHQIAELTQLPGSINTKTIDNNVSLTTLVSLNCIDRNVT